MCSEMLQSNDSMHSKREIMNKEKNRSISSLMTFSQPPQSLPLCYSKYSKVLSIPSVTMTTVSPEVRVPDVSSTSSGVHSSNESFTELNRYETTNSMSQQGGHSVIVPNAAVIMQQASPETSYDSPPLKPPYNSRENFRSSPEENNVTTIVNFNSTVCDINTPICNNSSALICTICGDRATGKHYGAFSCDGCKGFFRRSVRKNHNYNCRFNRNCIINKHKRNQCRFCRFRKCVKAGMKKEAVQNERDRISQRKLSCDEISSVISLSILVRAESHFRKFRCKATKEMIESMKIAGVQEVCDSMKQQLIALVEWSQNIPAFLKFSQSDKVSLLRARASEHLLLGAAWRSTEVDDVLLLGNDCIIPRKSPGMSHVRNLDPEINRIGRRVMNELVRTFRETNMDENEFVCLKGIVFFDPSIKGLQDPEEVKSIRYCVQLILEEYIHNRALEPRGRFGQLLLALQVLQSIAWQMVEQIQFAELFGSTKIDSLLAEMLLGELPDKDNGDSNPSPMEEGNPTTTDFNLILNSDVPLKKESDSQIFPFLAPENKKESNNLKHLSTNASTCSRNSCPSCTIAPCGTNLVTNSYSNVTIIENESGYIDRYLKQELVESSDVL